MSGLAAFFLFAAWMSLLDVSGSFHRIDRVVIGSASNAPARPVKVQAQAGQFSNAVCITGRVYVACDGSARQKNSIDVPEVGIPGVRLVLLDGTSVMTDVDGRYRVCVARAQTQVIKVDRSTLPKGAHLVPSSSRNAGVGDSLFIDSQSPFLRADFIEGSCSVEVMDQVRARRAQRDGDLSNNKILPALTI